MDWCPRILLGGAFFYLLMRSVQLVASIRAKSLSLSFFTAECFACFTPFVPFHML